MSSVRTPDMYLARWIWQVLKGCPWLEGGELCRNLSLSLSLSHTNTNTYTNTAPWAWLSVSTRCDHLCYFLLRGAWWSIRRVGNGVVSSYTANPFIHKAHIVALTWSVSHSLAILYLGPLTLPSFPPSSDTLFVMGQILVWPLSQAKYPILIFHWYYSLAMSNWKDLVSPDFVSIYYWVVVECCRSW